MGKIYKNCQSCDMPLKKDVGGTEVDGGKNLRYCSHCYQKGQFTEPDITVEGMQAKVKGIMKGMGFPGFIAGFLTKRIPKLERWKKV